jgi:hypothetical protein
VPFDFVVVVVANEAVVANVVPALAVSVTTTWTVLVPVPPEVSVLNEMLMMVVSEPEDDFVLYTECVDHTSWVPVLVSVLVLVVVEFLSP